MNLYSLPSTPSVGLAAGRCIAMEDTTMGWFGIFSSAG